MSRRRIDAVMAAVEEGSPKKLQERTRIGLRSVLVAVGRGQTVADAAAVAGVNPSTIKEWRVTYPAFGDEVARLIEVNQAERQRDRDEERRDRLEAKGLVMRSDDPVPDPGELEEFRMTYFGRPTPPHQQTAVMALEDLSNLYVFIRGPTGMGKDTLAGDYVSWRLAPDRTGLRVAWILKTGPYAKRRLGRLARYFTDPVAARQMPERTPGGRKPARSLIEDFGPFAWEPGMVWEDGTEVYRPMFTQDQMFFVRSTAPEQDPNLQAVGLEAALYGVRIDEAVLSDIFDLENQLSPTNRINQRSWVNGTLHSRLDEAGREVVIFTMLPIENNYEWILDSYLEDAHVIREVTVGPGTYQKYSNGVAVVTVKAIWTDEDGVEHSYWPERFPLEDHLINRETGESRVVADLDDAELLALADAGWRRRRGLYSIRAKDPVMFRAMYQQERDPDVGLVDFTDEVFEAAYDHERSFGWPTPYEIRLLGVDPAQRYGAAWLLLGVDREAGEMTVCDFWWGDRLGFSGIKDKLVLQPLGRFSPSWLCYEPNREGAVLADPEIQRAIHKFGVSVFTPPVGRERGDPLVGPGALATWMRMGKLRIPYATAEDRVKAEELKSHLRAFDANPDRSKPGRAGHHPDDVTFALYAAWRKGVQLVDRDYRSTGIVAGVPAAIRRNMDRRRKDYQINRAAKKKGKGPSPRETLTRGNPLEAILAMGDDPTDYDG